jgi:amino acid transporter
MPLGETGNFICKVIFIVVFTVINIVGLKEVARITTILVIFAIGTLGVFVYYGITNWQYNPVVPFAAEGQPFMTSLGFGMAFCIWVYSGYESMGTMAGELENPQVIPKATMLTIPVVMIVYILPILFGLASYGDYASWSVDQGVSFVTIMASYGIPGLTLIFTMGAIATNFSLYNSYLASASRSFFVISEDNLAPPIIHKVNKKFGTPHIAIISMAAVNLFLSQFGFATLVVIDVVLFMFAYLIWFFAAVALRIKEPDLPRPFKAPFGTKGMIVMIIAPTIICVTALFTNGINYLIGGCIGLMSGPVMYVIWKKMYGGLDKQKTLSKSQKNGVLILSGLIAAGLITGFIMLNNERISANESFDAILNDSTISANYDSLGSSYIIAEDSFALDLADRNNENVDTRIWYYYGDVTGDVYIYDEFEDAAAFSAAAFTIYQRLSGLGLSQIDIYNDEFWFVAYDGEAFNSAKDILAWLEG